MIRKKINEKTKRMAAVLSEEVVQTETAAFANTETKKVDVDPTSIAQTQVYKDMEYSFLKNYNFMEIRNLRKLLLKPRN